MPRKPNPFYDYAVLITDEMRPDARIRDRVLKQNLAHLSKLCNPDKSNGEKTYPPAIVFSAWRHYAKQLQADGLSRPSVIALIRESPNRIEQYLSSVLGEMPPVFLSQAHDDYVREHAEALKYLGFKYGGWLEADDQYSGKRLTFEEVKTMGLLTDEQISDNEWEDMRLKSQTETGRCYECGRLVLECVCDEDSDLSGHHI